MQSFFGISLIALTLLFMRHCDDAQLAERAPACVREKIEQIAKADVWNPPAKVYRYRYNDQTVYYITARCCDIPSQLYDSNCNLLCAPDGGFTGKGDGGCNDFFDTRTDETLIWEDDREGTN